MAGIRIQDAPLVEQLKLEDKFPISNGSNEAKAASVGQVKDLLTGDITEQLKDKQDKIQDLEAIREGANKGATALQSVPSEYVTEVGLNNALNSKVDKIAGKQLTTEDFTTALKAKLQGLSNYDDTTLTNAINGLRNDFNALVSGDTTTAIKTFNEVIAFLNGISDTQDLASIIAAIERQIAAKQDVIAELEDIKQGANDGKKALARIGDAGSLQTSSKVLVDAINEVYNSIGSGSGGGSGELPVGDFVTKEQFNNSLAEKQDTIDDLQTIRDGAALGATALQSIPAEYVTETELNAKGYLTEHQDISGKQDVISDLATIRENASKGATALQSIPSEYVTEDELTAKGYATTDSVNTELGKKVDKIEGKQLSEEDFTTLLKDKLEGLNNYDDTAISNALSSLQTQFNTLVNGNPSEAINSFNEIIAFLDGVKDTQDLSGIIASIEQQIAGKQAAILDLDTIRSGASAGATAVQPSSLASVATSGSYTDLKDKPSIPSEVTESTVSGWGFTKNAGTYSKPTDGIPKTDLASDVQGSLDKADTALQSVPSKYNIGAEDVAGEAGDVSGFATEDFVNNSVNTINETINSKADKDKLAYPYISQGLDITSTILKPNTFYVWGEVAALTLTLDAEVDGIANEYLFQFTSGATATTLSLPDTIKWSGGETPEIEAGKTYQVSILNNCATLLAF